MLDISTLRKLAIDIKSSIANEKDKFVRQDLESYYCDTVLQYMRLDLKISNYHYSNHIIVQALMRRDLKEVDRLNDVLIKFKNQKATQEQIDYFLYGEDVDNHRQKMSSQGFDATMEKLKNMISETHEVEFEGETIECPLYDYEIPRFTHLLCQFELLELDKLNGENTSDHPNSVSTHPNLYFLENDDLDGFHNFCKWQEFEKIKFDLSGEIPTQEYADAFLKKRMPQEYFDWCNDVEVMREKLNGNN